MRLWSFHPKYCDHLGLARTFNEGMQGLLANLGIHRFHRNHSALIRLREYDLFAYLRFYLMIVKFEAIWQGKWYKNFDLIGNEGVKVRLPVTTGQIAFEVQWLASKMRTGRCKNSAEKLDLLLTDYNNNCLELHPLFYQVDGEIEAWEKSHL